ncbi:MAG: 4-hydroxy-tetrahydrodipicolinate synthase [Spirochaetaceae bacterium]|jgi:4-hydroxy-tetrahydrodipicolinate synthase|nr:4-hydroxy-tetrahydrodipicolinate synthase [Spirochaetaceae bacterium]
MLNFSGAWTALITPMNENGAVNFDAWRELIRFQLDSGIDGLVPIGTTGETPTLDEEEEEELIKIAVEEARGKKPVLAGAGSNSTKHAIAYCERAKRLGADAVLVVTPYYNKPNDSGLVKHFAATAEVGLPVIVYNIAGRTGRNIPTPLMAKIAEISGIAGVKEASGDMNQMSEVLRVITAKKQAEGKDFVVLSGDDGLTVPLMSLGGKGVISVISNLFPKQVASLTAAMNSGDYKNARKLHFELMPFIHAAFIETNPVPIKYAMNRAGHKAGLCRLPLGELGDTGKQAVDAALRTLGVI